MTITELAKGLVKASDPKAKGRAPDIEKAISYALINLTRGADADTKTFIEVLKQIAQKNK